MAERPPRSFHVLAKPAGAICNLDCKYCFFLSKELLYPGSRFRMAESLLETYVRQLLEGQRGPEVELAWQGGEPTLLGLAFFRRAVELAERLRRPTVRVRHTIQTNGTTIDDEWAAFFRAHAFLVGISIDGPPELHDAYRVDKGGRGSFARVRAGLAALVRHGVEYNVLTTLHAGNAAHPLRVYRFLRDECGARFLQFIPVVERVESTELVPLVALGQGSGQRSWRERQPYRQRGAVAGPDSIAPEAFGAFLCEVFDEWVRHDVGQVYVQAFDVALASYHGAPPGVCVHAETCGDALALEHNGDLYSCDHFVEPDYRLGNILDVPLGELVRSERQRAFGRAKRDALPRYCRECEVLFACHGGCPKDRFTTTPEGEPGLNYLCVGYRRFFRHVAEPMREMSRLLSAGRAPAEIMRRFVLPSRRNEPCPCGSGKKLKHCHGRGERPPK